MRFVDLLGMEYRVETVPSPTYVMQFLKDALHVRCGAAAELERVQSLHKNSL